jgi:hypothetical protein
LRNLIADKGAIEIATLGRDSLKKEKKDDTGENNAPEQGGGRETSVTIHTGKPSDDIKQVKSQENLVSPILR